MLLVTSEDMKEKHLVVDVGVELRDKIPDREPCISFFFLFTKLTY